MASEFETYNGYTREEAFERWLELLRGGDYTQGRNQLKTPSGAHCCLGVYVEGVLNDFEAIRVNALTPSEEQCRFLDLRSALSPGEVNHLNALSYGGRWFCAKPDRMNALTFLNDDVGLSFTEIADFIESHGWNE